MYGPNEEKLKTMAQEALEAQEAQINQYGSPQTIGGLGGSLGKCARPSLMGRLQNQRERAQNQAREADRLAELTYLLDRNPEMARILDLLDAVRDL